MDGTASFSTTGTVAALAGSPIVGEVVDLSIDGPILDIGTRRVVGCRASSCLVEPATGDTVLAVNAADTTYVLAILARASDAPAVLSVPDTASATLVQDSLTLRCESLIVDAGTVTLRSRIARVAGQALHVVAERIDMVARTLRRSADLEFSHARNASRTVEGIETVTAGELILEARTAFAQRAGIVMVDACEDVRINGERITMG